MAAQATGTLSISRRRACHHFGTGYIVAKASRRARRLASRRFRSFHYGAGGEAEYAFEEAHQSLQHHKAFVRLSLSALAAVNTTPASGHHAGRHRPRFRDAAIMETVEIKKKRAMPVITPLSQYPLYVGMRRQRAALHRRPRPARLPAARAYAYRRALENYRMTSFPRRDFYGHAARLSSATPRDASPPIGLNIDGTIISAPYAISSPAAVHRTGAHSHTSAYISSEILRLHHYY